MTKLNHGEAFVFYVNVDNLSSEKIEDYVTKVRSELIRVGADANTAIIPVYNEATRFERI